MDSPAAAAGGSQNPGTEWQPQTANDERFPGLTNYRAPIAGAALASTLLLWGALFAAYRFDRTDAFSVASATVLLVAPPLFSYFLAMEFSRRRSSLARRIAAVYGLALVWLAVQRLAIYPAFGFAPSLGESIANFALLPAFGIASWLAARGLLDRRRLAKALEQRALAEQRLLGAQLAPHLLFNMLNTIYAVLLKDPAQATPLFLAMSEALRHLVGHPRQAAAPLADELELVEHFAVLERARQPGSVAITVSCEGDTGIPFPPLLLATLFENAVKHGRFPDGRLEIAVKVTILDEEWLCEVANRCPPASPNGTGFGLSSIKSRLELLYPGRHHWRAAAEDGGFRAEIRIVP